MRVVDAVRLLPAPTLTRALVAAELDDLCLSLVHSEERHTLDIKCRSREERDLWVAALHFLSNRPVMF